MHPCWLCAAPDPLHFPAGVLQLLQSRTSRKFLACRLTPDMETKLLFMTSRVSSRAFTRPTRGWGAPRAALGAAVRRGGGWWGAAAPGRLLPEPKGCAAVGYQSSDSSSAVREAQELLGDSTEELLSVLTAVQIHPHLLPPPPAPWPGCVLLQGGWS